MNALVLKSNKIVDIVDKRGEHYIDSNFNPYTKDELEFFIKQNIGNQQIIGQEEEIVGFDLNSQMMSINELNRMRILNEPLEKVLFIADKVLEQHPDYSPQRIGEFSVTLYQYAKKRLNADNGQ